MRNESSRKTTRRLAALPTCVRESAFGTIVDPFQQSAKSNLFVETTVGISLVTSMLYLLTPAGVYW
jgi:hypothetical protein